MVDDSETVQDATVVPDSQRGPARVELPPAGYDFGAVIGKGGMGEVIAAHDLRIGRDVAIKRMHAGMSDAAAVGRFLREARIQARLDHPAIVPVHELGTDAQGRPYFTMKRLAGDTLAQRLAVGGPCSHSCARSSMSVSRSSSRTPAASCTAISSPRTSSSAISARSTCSTGASRA